MNTDNKNEDTNATGLFALYANENDTGEEMVPTTRLVLWLDSEGSQSIAASRTSSIASQGVHITILGKAEPNTTYPFKSGVVVADYVPKNWAGNSWDSDDDSGQVIIDEVDYDKKTVKGTFEFTARSVDGTQTARIRGSFNLQN
jgi:hypothetical protein